MSTQEIARRQGRRASGADLLVVVSLPIALAVSLARTDALALWAAGWCCISYLYCIAAYHPSTLRGFVDWIVKIRSPFDVPAGENGGDNHFAV